MSSTLTRSLSVAPPSWDTEVIPCQPTIYTVEEQWDGLTLRCDVHLFSRYDPRSDDLAGLTLVVVALCGVDVVNASLECDLAHDNRIFASLNISSLVTAYGAPYCAEVQTCLPCRCHYPIQAMESPYHRGA
jgi:hypothetical protein